GVAALSWSLRVLGRQPRGQAVAVGVVSVALLVALQAATPTVTHEIVRGEGTSQADAPDAWTAGGGVILNRDNAPLPAIRLDPHDTPILGSPDAPVVLAEMIDYTCGHC